jgi:hypothetical protein
MGGEIVAVAPGKKIKRVVPERHVDGVAIVCDVLWTLTILGVAAPISDALLGTFVKTETPVEVKLEPDAPSENPMPVYSIFGTSVTASEEVPAPAVTLAPAPPPPPAERPPAPATTTKAPKKPDAKR